MPFSHLSISGTDKDKSYYYKYSYFVKAVSNYTSGAQDYVQGDKYGKEGQNGYA